VDYGAVLAIFFDVVGIEAAVAAPAVQFNAVVGLHGGILLCVESLKLCCGIQE